MDELVSDIPAERVQRDRGESRPWRWATVSALIGAAILAFGGARSEDEPQAGGGRGARANIADVTSRLDGPVTIISLVPEGTRVKKGAMICELDSSALRDQLTNQEIITKRAGADYENAKKTREVADIAVKEYVEGTYPLALQNAEIESELADIEESIAEDEFDRLRQAADADDLAHRRAELAWKRAALAAVRAKERLRRLPEFEKPARVDQLEAEVAKAKADELAMLAAFDLEQKKEAKLHRQIESCNLRAPCPGVVIYPMPPGGALKPGDQVQPGQVVVRVVEVD